MLDRFIFSDPGNMSPSLSPVGLVIFVSISASGAGKESYGQPSFYCTFFVKFISVMMKNCVTKSLFHRAIDLLSSIIESKEKVRNYRPPV